MPVSVYIKEPDSPEPRVATVEHICEVCGELIRKFEAFEDTVDKESRPVHKDCLAAVESGKDRSLHTDSDRSEVTNGVMRDGG